jgi:hypothetical protein
MNEQLASIALNVGSILAGGLGVYFLTKRDRSIHRVEEERRRELNDIRARIIILERFKLRITWYLERVGKDGTLPPWRDVD